MKALILSLGILSLTGAALLPNFAWADGKVIWRPTYRPQWMYYEDTAENTHSVLLKDQEAPVEHESWDPYRIELAWEGERTKDMAFLFRFIGGSTHFQVAPDTEPVAGFDSWMDFGWSFSSETPWTDEFETIATVRTYYATFEGNEIPDRGNIGWSVGIKPSWGQFSLLVEATTEAISLFTPEKMGYQQDASAFRVRGEYGIPLEEQGEEKDWEFVTGLEFFHTKADYSATEAVPGHQALFIDDIQLSLLLGVAAEY